MSLGKTQAKALAAATDGASSLTQGVCMSVDWSRRLATVNINGGQVAVPMVGRAPFPGDAVWVGFLGQQPICLGPIPKAATGTVLGIPTGDQLAVAADDGEVYTVPFVGTAPADGARVILDWDSEGTIIGSPSAAATPVVPIVPPSAGGGSAGSATFLPVSSGNFFTGAGWNKPELWTSDSNKGLWFHETQIPNTIPDGATEKVTRVYVDEYFNQFPSNLARIGTHPHASQPGGPPAVSGAHPVSAGSGWKDLTGTGIFDLLKTGAALGLGTNGIGYHKWSRAGVNNSGALYMEWN